MRDYRDAKTMAQSLRTALAEKDISIKQSESLEIIARTLGAKDWNTLSASIRSGRAREPERIPTLGKAPKLISARTKMPALPLRDNVVFPKSVVALYVGREESMRAVEQSAQGDGRVCIITQKSPSDEEPDTAGLHSIGVVAMIRQQLDADSLILINIEGLQRARVLNFSRDKFYEATIAPVDEPTGDRQEMLRFAQQLQEQFQTWALDHAPSFRLPRNCKGDPGYVADAIASRLPISLSDKQKVLETFEIPKRLNKLAQLIEQVTTST